MSFLRRRSPNKVPENTNLLLLQKSLEKQRQALRELNQLAQRRSLGHNEKRNELEEKYRHKKQISLTPRPQDATDAMLKAKIAAMKPGSALTNTPVRNKAEENTRIAAIKRQLDDTAFPSPPPMSKEDQAMHDRLKNLKREVSGRPKQVYISAEDWRTRMCTTPAKGNHTCLCKFLEWLLYKCEKTGCENVARKFEEKVVREQADIDQLYKYAQGFQKSEWAAMPCLKK